MPDHDVKKLESELKLIRQGSDELLKLIFLKGYTTPREFALVLGAAEGISMQIRTLVAVSKQIVEHAR